MAPRQLLNKKQDWKGEIIMILYIQGSMMEGLVERVIIGKNGVVAKEQKMAKDIDRKWKELGISSGEEWRRYLQHKRDEARREEQLDNKAWRQESEVKRIGIEEIGTGGQR